MQLVLFVASLVAALSLGCQDNEQPASSIPPPTAPKGRTPTPSPPARGSPAGERRIHDLAATVVDDAGVPVIGRPAVVVDARGKRLDLMTDEGGMFHVVDVVPPYDVAVEGAPSGPTRVPVVFLGLTREEPRLELVEHDGAAAQAAPQTLAVTISAPPCAASGCWICVASASTSGGGAAARALALGEAAGTIPIEHAWRTDAIPDGEEIDLHVLSGDESYSRVSYARVRGIAAQPGAATVIAASPAVVEMGPISVEARGPSIPSSWTWTVSTRLNLPGGASVEYQRVAGAALVTRVPLLESATFGVTAWARRPAEAGEQRRAAFASVEALALRPPHAKVLQVDLDPGPEIVRPRPDGTLSRRGSSFEWTPVAHSVVTLSVQDVSRGRRDLVVHTAGAAVSLRALDRLGLPPLEPGPHVLDLTACAGAGIDDIVDPERRRGPSTVGAHQRLAFVVTR